MDEMELIKTAHVIDQDLGRLAAVVADEELNQSILTVQAEWRQLAYRVTGHLCGLERDAPPVGVRRRGGRKRDSVLMKDVGLGDGAQRRTADGSDEVV